jgi:cold shock CspA family protein
VEGGQDGGSAVSAAASVPQIPDRTAAVGAAMGADAAAGGTQTQAPNQVPSQPAFRSPDVVDPVPNQPRRLGTLKSFSPAQGYGFIACEEVFANYQRDAYFDKSQLPSSNWHFGQTVEFVVIHNARGHPQARQIDWDPVPNLMQAQESGAASVLSGTTTSASVGSNPRLHSSQTLTNLRNLLQHLHESQPEKAVVQAINLQGGSNATGGASAADVDSDTDYVSFVLDRLGRETDAVPKIKDFVKMLLLLMLAKMLRSQTHPSRCQQHIRWFEALALTIEPAAESVREHFHSVVEQINNQLQSAHRENTVLSEDAQLPVLQAVFRKLQDKCVAV